MGGVSVKSVNSQVLSANHNRIKPGHHLITIEGHDVTQEALKGGRSSSLAMLKDETRSLKLELMTHPKQHVVVSIAENSAAAKNGKIQVGHILKAVGTTDISQMTNEDAMKAIASVERPQTLTLISADYRHHHHHHARKHNLRSQVAKKISMDKPSGVENDSS